MILETERLCLREMAQADYGDLCKILQDEKTMYAYAHAFSDAEVQAWLDNQRRRYREEGFGLWAMLLKDTGEMIGQCGLTLQDVDAQGTRAICSGATAGIMAMPRKRQWPAGIMPLTC